MSLTKASYSMIDGACINVRDYGAVGDGVTNDTAAFQAALAACAGAKALYIPAGSYKILDNTNATVLAAQEGQQIFGDGDLASVLYCYNSSVLSNQIFLNLAGSCNLQNIRLIGDTVSDNTGVRMSNPTLLNFTAYIRMTGCQVTGFKIGLDLGNLFNIAIRDSIFGSNATGVYGVPTTNSGDNGYINTTEFDNCTIRDNTLRGIAIGPTNGGARALSFKNCDIESNLASAQCLLEFCNPVIFDSCYFEGTSSVPAIQMAQCSATIKGTYFVSTGGILLENSNNVIELDNVRVADTTDVLNAGNALHKVIIKNTTLPSSGNTLTDAKQWFTNSSVNGTAYGNYTNQPFSIAVPTNSVERMRCYTKTVSATINAGVTTALIADQSVSGVMGAGCGFATITNAYNPGLILTLAPASTGSTNFFSVLATNTTASPITLASATLNVMIFTINGTAI
jgi:hypothetical protein